MHLYPLDTNRTIVFVFLVALVLPLCAKGFYLNPHSASCPAQFEFLTGGRESGFVGIGGMVYPWGRYWSGALGLDRASSHDIGDNLDEMGTNMVAITFADTAPVVHMSGYDVNVCAVFLGGKVRCWGARCRESSGGNHCGVLGSAVAAEMVGQAAADMATIAYLTFSDATPATVVSVGNAFACALFGSKIRCWGSNDKGQLGLAGGNAATATTGLADTSSIPFIVFDDDSPALRIDTGSQTVCADFLGESVFFRCWGSSGEGQAGYGDQASIGDDAGEMALLGPVPLAGTETFVRSYVGGSHTCATFIVDNVTRMKCWGSNYEGQIGVDKTRTELHRVLSPNAAPFVVFHPDFDGISIKQVATTEQNTCALFENGKAVCFGRGAEGVVGHGQAHSVGTSANKVSVLEGLLYDTTSHIVALEAQQRGMCSIFATGGVRCHGENGNGALGTGNGIEDVGKSGWIYPGTIPYVLPLADISFPPTPDGVGFAEASPVTVLESSGSVTLTVRRVLSAGGEVPFSINATIMPVTTDDDDLGGGVVGEKVTLNFGPSDTEQKLTFPVTNDRHKESPELFTVHLSTTNVGSVSSSGCAVSINVTIVSNDDGLRLSSGCEALGDRFPCTADRSSLAYRLNLADGIPDTCGVDGFFCTCVACGGDYKWVPLVIEQIDASSVPPGISSDYRPYAVCGDGFVFSGNACEIGEECDDGNTVDGDGCSSSCKAEPGWKCSSPSPISLGVGSGCPSANARSVFAASVCTRA